MVKKTKKFSDLALKIFKEHYDFSQEKELQKWKCDRCKGQNKSMEELHDHLRKKTWNKEFL